ncbi:MAG: glycosyltransferase, partial [Microbacterium sp.]|nr:glycosyltransferase [Microbacterium sp.]
PVVAYDVRYGPREALAASGGVLVPDGDVDALTAGLVRVLDDVDTRVRLSHEAVDAARAVDPEHVMVALASAVGDVLGRPSRRA